jgi:hypothetical protein
MAFDSQEITSVTIREFQQLKFSQLCPHEKVTVKKRCRPTTRNIFVDIIPNGINAAKLKQEQWISFINE